MPDKTTMFVEQKKAQMASNNLTKVDIG